MTQLATVATKLLGAKLMHSVVESVLCHLACGRPHGYSPAC